MLLPIALAFAAAGAGLLLLRPARPSAASLTAIGQATGRPADDPLAATAQRLYTEAVGLQSAAAMRLGISNTPTPDADANLQRLIATVVAPLQLAVAPARVRISSAYRSPEVNAAVGGVRSSDHMTGKAIDLKVEGQTAAQTLAVVQRLRLPVRQAIVYAPAAGGHLHVGLGDGSGSTQTLFKATSSSRTVPWTGQVG